MKISKALKRLGAFDVKAALAKEKKLDARRIKALAKRNEEMFHLWVAAHRDVIHPDAMADYNKKYGL